MYVNGEKIMCIFMWKIMCRNDLNLDKIGTCWILHLGVNKGYWQGGAFLIFLKVFIFLQNMTIFDKTIWYSISRKGGIFVYHELSNIEIDKFVKKYLYPYDYFKSNINSISCINYNNISEYLINKEFILRVYN